MRIAKKEKIKQYADKHELLSLLAMLRAFLIQRISNKRTHTMIVQTKRESSDKLDTMVVVVNQRRDRLSHVCFQCLSVDEDPDFIRFFRSFTSCYCGQGVFDHVFRDLWESFWSL